MNQWRHEVSSGTMYFMNMKRRLLEFPFLLAPQSQKIIAVERFVFCIFCHITRKKHVGKQKLFTGHLRIVKNSILIRYFLRHEKSTYSNIAQDLGKTLFIDIKFDRAHSLKIFQINSSNLVLTRKSLQQPIIENSMTFNYFCFLFLFLSCL